MPALLIEAYERLLAHYGPQSWWPGESPFEIMVGAVLVQNTNWKNAERAIENLREGGVLSLAAIDRLNQQELEELIRPAGYYRLKARRLRNLVDWIMGRYAGSLQAARERPLGELRAELLAINGIGPETADAIALYAAGKPTFVVDAYTHRVVKRHGWVAPEADYHEVQGTFLDSLEHDARLFNEYHALLVRVGKDFCKKVASCEGCPLRAMLPAGGPIEPEGL